MILSALMREREIVYSRSPRDLMAGFTDRVVFELGLGNWTRNGLPASGQKTIHHFR